MKVNDSQVRGTAGDGGVMSQFFGRIHSALETVHGAIPVAEIAMHESEVVERLDHPLARGGVAHADERLLVPAFRLVEVALPEIHRAEAELRLCTLLLVL